MNRPFVFAVLTLLIIISAIVYIPSLIDGNRYRDFLASRMSDFLNIPVRIEGEVEISLFPSQSLLINNIIIGNPELIEDISATIEVLQVDLIISSLLKGELKFNNPVLKKFNLNIDVSELEERKGYWIPIISHLHDFINVNKEINLIEFNEVSIQKSNIVYINNYNNSNKKISNINIDISAKNLIGPFKSSGFFQFGEIPIEMDVSVGSIGNSRPAGIRIDLNIEDTDEVLLFRGTHSTIDADWALKGSLELEGKNFFGLINKISNEFNKSSPIIPQIESKYQLTSSVFHTSKLIQFSDINIKTNQINTFGSFKYFIDDEPNFETKFTFNQLNLDSVFPNILENQNFIFLKNNWKIISKELLLNNTGTVKFFANGVSFKERLLGSAEVEIEIADQFFNFTKFNIGLPGISIIQGNGQLEINDEFPQFNGQVYASSENTRELFEWMGADLNIVPQGRLNNFEYTGLIRITPNVLQAYNFNSIIDSTTINGSLGVALQRRTAFSADINVDRLNFDSYILSDQLIDYINDTSISILESFDTNINFSINELTLFGQNINNMKVDLGLLDGVLAAREISIQDIAGTQATFTGIASDFSNNMTGTGIVNIYSDDPRKLFQYSNVSFIESSANLGALIFNAKLDGNLNDFDLDVGAKLGDMKLRLSGDVNDLRRSPIVDINFNATHPSLSNFVANFNKNFKDSEIEIGKLNIDGFIKGGLEKFSLDLLGEVGGSNIKVVGEIGNEGSFIYSLNLSINDENIYSKFPKLDPLVFDKNSFHDSSFDAFIQGDFAKLSVSQFDLLVGQSKISGNFDVLFDRSRPQIFIDILEAEIDIDSYFTDKIISTDETDWSPEWPGSLIQYNLLDLIDLKLSVNSKKFTLFDTSIENSKFIAEIKGGDLSVGPFTGDLFKGKLNATLSASREEIPKINLFLSIKDADITDAPKIPFIISPTTGVLELILDINAEGESVRELASNIDGKLDIKLEEGNLVGLNFSNLFQDILDLKNITGFSEVLEDSFSDHETRYSEIHSVALINGGVLNLDTFSAVLSGASILAQGNLEIPRKRSNIDFSISLVDDLEPPPFMLKVSGPWNTPRTTIRARELQYWVTDNLGLALGDTDQFFGSIENKILDEDGVNKSKENLIEENISSGLNLDQTIGVILGFENDCQNKVNDEGGFNNDEGGFNNECDALSEEPLGLKDSPDSVDEMRNFLNNLSRNPNR